MWWNAVFQEQWTASILPRENSTPWELGLEGVDAWLVACNPVSLIPAARSDVDCPEVWLPYLAEERSVDEYNGKWPLARRRSVVGGAMLYHQKKGTRSALEKALSPLGFSLKIVEWFEVEPRRQPYTFRLTVRLPYLEPWQAAERSQLIRLANSAKNAHTKLDAIELVADGPPALIHIGIALRRRRKVSIGQVPRPSTHMQPTTIYAAALLSRRHRVVVRQQA